MFSEVTRFLTLCCVSNFFFKNIRAVVATKKLYRQKHSSKFLTEISLYFRSIYKKCFQVLKSNHGQEGCSIKVDRH